MNNLTIINQNGQLVTDSREIAEIVGKQHAHLLRDIKGYIEILTQSNFGFSDFFIESIYQDSTGRSLPCYLLTKKGCDMVANKMTGEKGVLFTATYIDKFYQMEKALKEQQKPACIEDVLITSLQEMKALRQQLNEVNHNALAANAKAEETKQEVQAIRDVVAINPNSWRTEITNLLNKIAKQRGGTSEAYREVREEGYKLLDGRAGAKLSIRLTNRRRKVLEETGSKSKADKVSKLDCIADDKRLTEVYLAIVKEMAIKYKVA